MKPILFNTEMVRAIIAGRKTQTRRLFKVGPKDKTGITAPGESVYEMDGTFHYLSLAGMSGPYPPAYNKGDILYVRETWTENKNPESNNFGNYEFYTDYDGTHAQDLITWRPSIHMPKEAARLFLRITDVRVERLQDISEEDAIDEGYDQLYMPIGDPDPKGWFQNLWIRINGHESWNANPWVWAYTFERIEKP